MIPPRTKVEKVDPLADGDWNVTVIGPNGQPRTNRYGAVLVANGHHWNPRLVTFQYAADKTAIEAAIQKLANELPDVAIAWTRPVIIAGKGVSNYLSRFVLNIPIIFLPDGEDVALHFVHEDDCVAATWEILRQNARGPFNVGPNDYVPLTKLAKLTNRRVMKVPFWTFKLATAIWWGLRLPIFDFPPSLHDFIRYPWVVAPTRLQEELGFQFRCSSEDTLLEMWGEHCRKKERTSTAKI